MPPGRLTLTSHVPRRDHTRKSGTCSRHPDRVWNRRRNGCEHTSISSPAKSNTSSSRCSWMLSNPWWRPVLIRYCKPGRCRCPACQANRRTGSAPTTGSDARSRTAQVTSVPDSRQPAVHRLVHPGPHDSSRPARSPSPTSGRHSSSQPHECDQIPPDTHRPPHHPAEQQQGSLQRTPPASKARPYRDFVTDHTKRAASVERPSDIPWEAARCWSSSSGSSQRNHEPPRNGERGFQQHQFSANQKPNFRTPLRTSVRTTRRTSRGTTHRTNLARNEEHGFQQHQFSANQKPNFRTPLRTSVRTTLRTWFLELSRIQ